MSFCTTCEKSSPDFIQSFDGEFVPVYSWYDRSRAYDRTTDDFDVWFQQHGHHHCWDCHQKLRHCPKCADDKKKSYRIARRRAKKNRRLLPQASQKDQVVPKPHRQRLISNWRHLR